MCVERCWNERLPVDRSEAWRGRADAERRAALARTRWQQMYALVGRLTERIERLAPRTAQRFGPLLGASNADERDERADKDPRGRGSRR